MATDLYVLMGVGADASPEQIAAAYDHWAQETNPDPDAAATASLRELQNAYAILGHPERRRAYERQLARQKLALGCPSRAEPMRAEETTSSQQPGR